MKRGILFAALLAASAAIAWLASRTAAPPNDAPPVSPIPASSPADTTSAAPPSPIPPAPREPATPAATPRAVATPTSATTGPRSHVFGRLMDELDAPVAGADVHLTSIDGEWRTGVEVPEIEWRGYRVSGFEMRSDARGEFDFDVPLPMSDWVSLYIEPDEFHAIDDRDFGPAGGRNRERLKEGDNDLGTFHLAATGAVDGVVRASNGAAIAKAEISIHGALPGGRVIYTRSESDGTYVLGHVPEGTWSVGVKRDGFRSSQAKSIAAAKRAHTRGVDFALETAATIQGVVVDERGTPIAGVRVWAWPKSSGQGAGARTAADGSFTMPLPQNDPYSFDFEHAGYEHFGGDRTALYEPGATGVRLVMHALGSAEVRVVDAASGAPIESYGIAFTVVESASGGTDEGMDVPKIESHPDGRATLPRERGKIVARVIAPGYASASVPFADASDGVQTLRMAKAATMSGRVMLADAPIGGVKLELTAARMKRDASKTDDEEDDPFSDNYTSDVTGFAGRKRDVESSSDGHFRFDDLSAGHFTLAVRSAKSAPHVVKSIAVTSQQALDLGDVVLAAGASIHGRIGEIAGRRSDGWMVSLDREWSEFQRETDSSGLFHFDGIEPGKHKLFVRTARTVNDAIPLLDVELAAGETKDVVLDVSPLLPARVTVRVTRDGRPVEGVRVRGTCEATHREISIGTETDARGEVRGDCPPCEAVHFDVLSPIELVLGANTVNQTVAAAAQLDVEIAITTGRAQVEFPADFVVPPRGMAYLMINPLDSNGSRRKLVTCGTSDQPMPTRIAWKSRTIELGDLAPGEYEISANVQQTIDTAGGVPTSRPVASVFNGKLSVKSGELAVCELAPKAARK